MNERIDPYVAYRLQLLQEGQALRSLWERMSHGEPGGPRSAGPVPPPDPRHLGDLRIRPGSDSPVASAGWSGRAVARPGRGSLVEPLLAALLEASLCAPVSQPAPHTEDNFRDTDRRRGPDLEGAVGAPQVLLVEDNVVSRLLATRFLEDTVTPS